MVIKIATHTFYWEKHGKFPVGFREWNSLCPYGGMAQGESIEKIGNVLFKDVVPMAQEKQNIARG